MLLVNKFLSISLITSLLFSYSIFNPDDWYLLKSLDNINAITEDYNNVHIASHNGFFSYDKVSEEYYYNTFLSHGINNSLILHFYYDVYSDYYWLVQMDKISMRSSLSDYWREVSISDLGLLSYYEVIDIGSSDNYIWLRTSEDIFAVNPISGLRVKEQIN